MVSFHFSVIQIIENTKIRKYLENIEESRRILKDKDYIRLI